MPTTRVGVQGPKVGRTAGDQGFNPKGVSKTKPKPQGRLTKGPRKEHERGQRPSLTNRAPKPNKAKTNQTERRQAQPNHANLTHRSLHLPISNLHKPKPKRLTIQKGAQSPQEQGLRAQRAQGTYQTGQDRQRADPGRGTKAKPTAKTPISGFRPESGTQTQRQRAENQQGQGKRGRMPIWAEKIRQAKIAE